MTKKEARAECRKIALEGYGFSVLAWSKGIGFYPSTGQSDKNNICFVDKSGRFFHPYKKEYLNKFHLYDKQNQFGQEKYNGG